MARGFSFLQGRDCGAGVPQAPPVPTSADIMAF